MSESISANTSKGVSGSTLKIIAIVTMLIDHIGVTLVSDEPLYTICRAIGRLAFPIFCFLLIEGFLHTRNVTRYGIRLFLFALISEVPFDLAFRGSLCDFYYQNVFFTLFIGLMTITVFSEAEKKLTEKYLLCKFCKFLALIAGMAIAYAAKTDYSYIGVLTIVLFYELRANRLLATTFACICLSFSSILELTALTILPLTCCYNGKRGLNLKYIFYLFYPLHLLILYFIGKSF